MMRTSQEIQFLGHVWGSYIIAKKSLNLVAFLYLCTERHDPCFWYYLVK